jgi:hypothetical protein
MLHVDVTGSRLVIEQRNRFVQVMGIVFLALTALMILGGFVARAHVGAIIGPAIACGFVGIVYGFVPNRRTFEADKASGDLRVRVTSLFSSKEHKREVGSVTRVDVIVGTYNEWINLVFSEDAPMCIASSMKMWTFASDARGPTKQTADKIGAFFGVPVS